MPAETGPDLRVLVRGVVVEDHVDDLAGRHLGFDEVEETDEILVAVALHAAAADLSVEDVESGEQSGGAMSLDAVGHGPGAGVQLAKASVRASGMKEVSI